MKCFRPNIINLCILLTFITFLFFIHLIRGEEEDNAVPLALLRVSQAELKFSNRLFKIFRNVEEATGERDNLVFSPLIMHLALSGLKAASDGDTVTEINGAGSLGKLDNSVVQDGYKELIDLMKTDETATLKLINRIFTSSLFKIDGSFARVLRDKLNLHINPLDFSNITLASSRVNSFISNYTNGTIRNFIGEGEDGFLEPLDRVVLLNTLYFKSGWDHEFTPLMTEKGTFYTDDGNEVKVEMMNRGGFYPYGESVELNSTVLAVPYKGGRFSLVILLPERGIPMSQLESNLETYPMQRVLAQMEERYIQVSIPKFTVDSNIDMIGPLQLLGIKTLLSPHANLTKMSKKHGLFVNKVMQRGFFSVGEGGTEVSASHFVESVPASPRFLVPFVADRPFVFFLHDRVTNTILFVGKKMR